jgi:hypothetical protein
MGCHMGAWAHGHTGALSQATAAGSTVVPVPDGLIARNVPSALLDELKDLSQSPPPGLPPRRAIPLPCYTLPTPGTSKNLS